MSVELVEEVDEASLSWAFLNQRFEPTTAQMFHQTNAAFYRLAHKKLGFGPTGWDGGLFLVYAAIDYRMLGKVARPDARIQRRVTAQLFTERTATGDLERAHLCFRAELRETHSDGLEPFGAAECWQSITRLFASKERRKIGRLPAPLAELTESPVEDSHPVSRPPERFVVEPGDGSPGTGAHDDFVVFHADRTDPMQHVTTGAYLQIAVDATARAAHVLGGDVSALRFERTQTRLRKPFRLGDRGLVKTRVAAVDGRLAAHVHLHHDVDGEPSERVSVAHIVSGRL